ncbi:peptidoglycan DD-metalloendopeptidase family protein [Gynuella sp.]|uniref:peptidoglycan DD-metalloendopeptidase family protein n=1 Tax=Gynuella sp. TaxID=2969146 RepID=UPI003D1089AD
MLQSITQLPKVHRLSIGALVLLSIFIMYWPQPSNPVQVSLVLPDFPQEPNVTEQLPANSFATFEIVLGDSLSTLFDKALVSPQIMLKLIADKHQKELLRNIHPGETMVFEKNPDGELVGINYIKSPLVTERFDYVDGSFNHRTLERTPEYRTRYAGGAITSSLFLAGQQAGMSDALTMELAQIFGWDIDFALDIRSGDSFSLIYQEKFLDGQFLGYGPILAAKFTNNGKEYAAVRFTDDKGHSDFYSPNGRSMRKAFLRTPVEFTRISSPFSLGRKHPILNKIRNHKGTDYAAPSGTPIKAAGDGKITYAGKKGGYGNVVVIQHGQRYSTYYAHMRAFAKSTRSGKMVKQGQIIGYVGMTGLATGPHLHYEFRVNGVPVNPVTVKLPSAEPIKKNLKVAFERHATNMLGQLASFETNGFAKAD